MMVWCSEEMDGAMPLEVWQLSTSHESHAIRTSLTQEKSSLPYVLPKGGLQHICLKFSNLLLPDRVSVHLHP